jgi:dienelactone hydrolase
VLLIAPLLLSARSRHATVFFTAHGTRIAVDEYFAPPRTPDRGSVVILCGSGGLNSPFPYVEEAKTLSAAGRTVFLPHFLDATKGARSPAAAHYPVWVETVNAAIGFLQSRSALSPARTALVGYSLGGSVALALAARRPVFAAVVVWSGSMPDAYRDAPVLPPILIVHGERDSVIPPFNARRLSVLCRIRHFRCDVLIEPDEGHLFTLPAIARANLRIGSFLDRVLPAR